MIADMEAENSVLLAEKGWATMRRACRSRMGLEGTYADRLLLPWWAVRHACVPAQGSEHSICVLAVQGLLSVVAILGLSPLRGGTGDVMAPA